MGTLSRGYRALRHNGKEVTNMEMSRVLVFARDMVFARERVALLVASLLQAGWFTKPLLSPKSQSNVENITRKNLIVAGGRSQCLKLHFSN